MPGSSPDVGVVGYTLGGGLSWFGAQARLRLQPGRGDRARHRRRRARTVDAENDADLFWALRGGGGGYAIVTALHVELLPIAEIYAGALLFPAEVGAEAVRAYRDWAATAPDEVTSVVRFVTPPPIPDVPEPLRGTPLLTIDGACIGTQEEGEAAFAPLREIGETIMDTFDWMPTAGLSRIHMDPENPVPGIGDGELVARADRRGDRRLRRRRRRRTRARRCCSASCATSAARSAAPAEDGGALSHLDAGFAMYSVGMPMTPELGEAIPGHLDEDRRDDEALGRRGRLLQLHRGALRRRRDPAPPTSAPASARSSASGTRRAGSSPTTRSRWARSDRRGSAGIA